MSHEVARGGPRWRTVRVPAELDEKLKALSERTKWAKWKVILEAIAMYESFLRKPRAKGELPVVDKIVWYVEKLCMSVGALKERPVEENLRKTTKTVAQIRERLKVDTSLLEKAVVDYYDAANSPLEKGPDERHAVLDEATVELNMALKSVLLEIAYNYILKEEAALQPKAEGGGGERE